MVTKINGFNKEVYKITDDGDNVIEAGEISLDSGVGDAQLIENLLEGHTLTAADNNAVWELDTLLKNAGKISGSLPSDPKEAAAALERLAKRLEALDTLITKLNATKADDEHEVSSNGADKPAVQARLNALKQAEAIRAQTLARLEQAATEAKGKKIDIPSAAQKFLSKGNGTNGAGTATAKFASGESGAAPGAKAAGGGSGAEGEGWPFGMTPGAMNFRAAIDPNAFYQSGVLEDMRLAALDSAHESELMTNKILMLMHYFAQRAMSGIEGMFEFMRFIGMIITKDNARQTVDLAGKQIELQQRKREKLNEMLSIDSKTDPDAFTKALETNRQETSAIDTDMKMIAQMQEDFAQVIEATIGMETNLLQSVGRVNRMVTQPS